MSDPFEELAHAQQILDEAAVNATRAAIESLDGEEISRSIYLDVTEMIARRIAASVRSTLRNPDRMNGNRSRSRKAVR